MGSLVAGWDSPVLGDDTKARAMRNRSLTKEEVEAFWRQHGKAAPVDVGDVTSPLGSPWSTYGEEPAGKLAEELVTSVVSGAGGPEEIGTSDAGKSRDWWTKSNSAFLNEPPQEERPGTAHSYTPQFHVAAGNA